MISPRRFLLVLTPMLAVLLTLVATSAVADAHTETSATAGPAGTTVITYSFSHGCTGSPTIGLRAKVPTGAWNVTPANPTGWTSTVSTTEIHWTGPAIPDGTAANFPVSMVLVEPVGSTVTLPVVQECTGGSELAWIDPPSADDDSEATHPAPTIVVPANATQPPVTTTIPDTTTATAGPTSTVRMAANANAITNEGSPTNSAGLWVFGGVCLVILAGAAFLFLRHRRASKV